jgi:hypothetical protein
MIRPDQTSRSGTEPEIEVLNERTIQACAAFRATGSGETRLHHSRFRVPYHDHERVLIDHEAVSVIPAKAGTQPLPAQTRDCGIEMLSEAAAVHH